MSEENFREWSRRQDAKAAQSEGREKLSVAHIDFVRHGNRFGGAIDVTLNKLEGERLTLDDKLALTPTGRANSKNFGGQFYGDATLVHPRGGDELRHGQ